MRITIILGPFLPVPTVLGGAVEKVHSLLARTYRAAGHDVTIVSRRYADFAVEETVDGIRYIRINSFDRTSSLFANLILDFTYALRASLHSPRSDITITNSFFLPLTLRRRTAGKIYVHVARYPKHQMFLYYRADRIQAISRAVADEVVNQTPFLSSKVVSIGYPASDVFFSRTDLDRKHKTVLFVGRLAREKGVHLLVRAFATLQENCNRIPISEWKLRIVGPHEIGQGGDGVGYLQELIDLARPLGQACEFAGPIFDEENLAREYKAASVFAYPSVAEKGEALGLAPLEAMAAGCAVIVSNLRCFDDFIQDGENAIKFDHRGPDPVGGLATTLAQVLSDAHLRERIMANGAVAARRFDAASIAARMLDDFQSLVRLSQGQRLFG